MAPQSCRDAVSQSTNRVFLRCGSRGRVDLEYSAHTQKPDWLSEEFSHCFQMNWSGIREPRNRRFLQRSRQSATE